ncbi:MAG: DUF4199 domain-containing protein [Taibaiella sp.]|nr:DUF4199 domain-containing protein [Taibaiella sp.]
MENNADFNRFTIPLRWGLIIGFVSILLFTIYSMFMMETAGMLVAGGFGVFSFILMMILLTVMAFAQRKAIGGFITFKDAFSAVFVSILIVVVMSQLYTIIYTNFIDPEYYEKTLQMTQNMTIQLGVPDDAADEAFTKAEEQIEKQKSVSGILMSAMFQIILYSLFGFIIAAIVKRNKPEHLQA